MLNIVACCRLLLVNGSEISIKAVFNSWGAMLVQMIRFTLRAWFESTEGGGGGGITNRLTVSPSWRTCSLRRDPFESLDSSERVDTQDTMF